MQAALLRGFARKRLAEQEGTYKPLMGDPEEMLDDADEWSAPPHIGLHLTYSPLLSLFPFHCHHPFPAHPLCSPPVQCAHLNLAHSLCHNASAWGAAGARDSVCALRSHHH